ncbi:DUF2637 domain-containing protein [Streptomyces smyrnaeus]|uniref:DUF2637 domain-containing protein n=1 Tax=Streptomyces smyrnaeus TaxID=1387713 RepID=UPI0036C6D24F
MSHLLLNHANGNGRTMPAVGGLVAADGSPLVDPIRPERPAMESPQERSSAPIHQHAPETPASATTEPSNDRSEPGGPELPGTKARWLLIGVVVLGALVIAAIGFAGSYKAVRDLAVRQGFGGFAPYFPIGIDAGIVVLLALDLLLTWLRIAFPLLRQAAWLLTGATVAFNAAAAWPDPLGVGMHSVIPLLFIVSVEAARHAVGRVADITADKHMEGVRLARWLLAPPSTFRLWRRMKLWELRSYEEAVTIAQDWAVYRERLRAQYGRTWRRSAPTDAVLPLRLARYGLPVADAVACVRSPDAPAPDRIPPRTDAPDTERIPASPDAPRPTASGKQRDAPKRAASRGSRTRTPRASARPGTDAATTAGKPATDDERRALLRRLAAEGRPPASIRQAADVLGCRQSKAKQLLATEDLLNTANAPKNAHK